jgi:hypothetical protein
MINIIIVKPKVASIAPLSRQHCRRPRTIAKDWITSASSIWPFHSMGLQAQSDAGREVFSTRVTRGNY